MSIDYKSSEHLSEEELARLLDDEVVPDERAAWNDHLEACSDCSQVHDELSDTAGWLRENVWVLDAGFSPNDIARARALEAVREKSRPATPAAPRQNYFLRAAAIIGVTVVAGFSVSPVRAWVLDHVERLTGSFEASPVAEVSGPAVEEAGAIFAFSPTESTFRLELGNAQATGVVTIEVADVEQASAQIVGGDQEMPILLPAGLLIENGPTSAASYRIRLPAGFIRQIEVRAGGELIASRTLTGVPERISLNLAPGARSR